MRADWNLRDLENFKCEPGTKIKICTACDWDLPETMFSWKSKERLRRIAKCQPCVRSKARALREGRAQTPEQKEADRLERSLERERIIRGDGEFRYKIIPGEGGDYTVYHYHEEFAHKIYPDEMGEFLTARQLSKLPIPKGRKLRPGLIRDRIEKGKKHPFDRVEYVGIGARTEFLVGDEDTPRLASQYLTLPASGDWRRNSLAVDWSTRT